MPHAKRARMRLTLLAIFLVPTLLSAADICPSGNIDVPVVDIPDIYSGHLRVPTMQQSIGLSSAFYETSAVAIQCTFGKHERRGKVALALFDVITLEEIPLPLADAWLHEEWHRAVLANRRIDSHNDVYNFDIGADSISVSHVRDEDLIRLKREHPADQVRLQEAGIEAELMLAQRLEKDRFFRGSTGWHLPMYWLVKLGTWGYVASGGKHDSDVDTDDSNRREGADVPRRDFTGHDFNGWVYDLFRPDEPYEARGIHPSGVGINRYRKSTDMTPQERAFLRRQGRLQLINFLDPNLGEFDGVTIGKTTVNANAAHLLTSFGYVIDANVFARRGEQKLFVTLHDYVNGERSFPGIDAELIEYRFRSLLLTPRVALWLQPDNQRFRDRNGALGGLLAMRIDAPMMRRVGSFVEVEAKSAGWVAGNVHLDRAAAVRFGLTAKL